MTQQPLHVEEFVRLVEALGPWLPDVEDAPIGVAVSGGADSLALAWLARQWRKNIVAFVVDHGLRAEAAAEARGVAQQLAALGIVTHVLKLAPFPSGRIQERARDARFDALEKACAEAGCIDLLVGHHLHDQDETVWMRSAAGSGSHGLAGIAPVSIRGRIRVVRPLLSVHPERLRGMLRRMGLDWVEDPSNHNRRFERVRWRQDLTSDQRLQSRVWQRQADSQRKKQDEKLAYHLAQYATWHAEGWVFLHKDGLEEHALSSLIRLVAGNKYRPAREKVQSLLRQGQGTLGGVTMQPAGRFGEGVLLVREERAVEKKIPAHSCQVWDQRWLCRVEDIPEGAQIGAVGDYAAQYDGRKLGVPARALRVLPALWYGNEIIRLPQPLSLSEETSFIWAGNVPITGENPVAL
ncbi:tRNA lysidine(34) synthetase TilS [Swingsia samuiensis]|uniref:tRNA lysidine(34) synthetase TilS n=1 Tax=Swingsia samuiensis TaxID=1293412 RepID=UPI001FECDB72|nr:tRNA lysidine(34) synthetase TilS [Swingsia samuiensis]